tara:strand:- start:168 stop:398 length:231 start_codon:yes stop_codon:yes gene_type:complete
MTYWPDNWECRRVAGGRMICGEYLEGGTHGQCARQECIYSSEDDLYQINNVQRSTFVGRPGGILSDSEIEIIITGI